MAVRSPRCNCPRFWLAAIIAALVPLLASASDSIQIELPEGSAPLEQEGARDLRDKLRVLFPEHQVQTVDRATDTAAQVIALGSPQRHARLSTSASHPWPPLSDQGYCLQSFPDRRLIVAGGNTPTATWWSVQALIQQLGYRPLLHGDLAPQQIPALPLTLAAGVFEPTHAHRGWCTWTPAPISWQAWGIADHTATIRQLSKLRYNVLVWEVAPDHPFVAFQFRGLALTTPRLFPCERIPIVGDLVGKKALLRTAPTRSGRDYLINPDLPAPDSNSQTIPTDWGTSYVRELQRVANYYGLRLVICASPGIVSHDFAPLIPAAKPVDRVSLAPAEKESATAWALWEALGAAYQQTYPGIDWAYAADPGQAPPSELPAQAPRVRWITARQGLASGLPFAWGTLLHAALHDPRISQPVVNTSSATDRDANAKPTGEIICIRGGLPGESDFAMYDAASALWSGRVEGREDFERAFHAYWLPSIGMEAAVDRMWRAEQALARVSTTIAAEDPDLGRLDLQMVLREAHPEPTPAWWDDVTKSYGTYTTELYRAFGAFEGPAKAELFYHAKRGEYASEFMTAVQAVRAASRATANEQHDAAQESWEAAQEAVYNAITALADGARDPSDRALIALLNAYAYRPLLNAAEESSSP